MMISTRGQYALRVMIDLAENGRDSFIPMKTIAARQGISLKYLERILPALTRACLVEGVQGKGGGYRLCRTPAQCRVGDILRAAEGDLAPVACLEHGAVPCTRMDSCRTISMWNALHDMVNDYFDNITIADLMRRSSA